MGLTWEALCRKLTCLVDKVNAAKLNREFKSFKAFMKQLDARAPAGEPFSLGPHSSQDGTCWHLQTQHE